MLVYYKNMYVVKDNFYDSIELKFIVDRFIVFEVEDLSKIIEICREFENKFNNELGM